ncbi:MAG: hypothetical protein Q8875_02755 [Pigeon pea little leaf phytoplasma]|nr:hypothetical protein [Pigeon pea little leaf phytoplasma]
MRTITRDLKDIKEFMSNQVAIKTQILAFMRNPVSGAAGSPVVGSNSATRATPSRQHDVSGKEKDAVKAPPITRSYHRRRGKSAMESTADPTYVPESTPLSSSEQGTFHFTRSKKRYTPFKAQAFGDNVNWETQTIPSE